MKPREMTTVIPHFYVPSAMHMGDCAVCGHLQHAPIHQVPSSGPSRVLPPEPLQILRRGVPAPPYAAIIETFPANVAVEIDHAAGVVNFRVAGNRVSVAAEIERIGALVTARGAMVRFMGPIKWGGLWEISHVVFGELRILP